MTIKGGVSTLPYFRKYLKKTRSICQNKKSSKNETKTKQIAKNTSLQRDQNPKRKTIRLATTRHSTNTKTSKTINMYRYNKPTKTNISVNKSYQGESIEQKIMRIVNNKEPIKDGAPRIYTERKDGVRPEFDIRTDRFEIAIEAMDKVSKSHLAKREQRLGEQAKKNMEKEGKTETKKNGGPEPSQATDPQ